MGLYSALASKGKQVETGEAECVLKKEGFLTRRNRATRNTLEVEKVLYPQTDLLLILGMNCYSKASLHFKSSFGIKNKREKIEIFRNRLIIYYLHIRQCFAAVDKKEILRIAG